MTVRKLVLATALAALAAAAPVHAQTGMNMPGMKMPGMKMPMPKKSAPAKKKVAAKKTGSAKKSTAKAKSTKKPPKHSSRSMSSMPGMNTGGHHKSAMRKMKMPKGQIMPGMSMPQGQGMPGMQMPSGQSMPGMTMSQGETMPGMDMPAMTMGGNTDAEAAGTNLPVGNAPPPPVPSDHAADRSFPPSVMATARHRFDHEQGGQHFYQLLVNLAEYQARKGRDDYEWNGEAWYGGDINRLWLKSEGDGTIGKGVDRAEVQALYSRAIDPYFNLQTGVRYDFKPNPSRVYVTVGVEGLAPGMFDVEGALFLSNKGELMARGEAWYDQRITQRLILQPRVELNFAAQNSPAIRVGSGLSDGEIGARLRYEIRREFSPYVGVQYRAAFGATRRYQRAAGEDPAGWSFLAGIRTWF